MNGRGALIDKYEKARHEMKKVKAIIEKAQDGGISIYAEGINGAYGYGLTESEAKEDFVSVLEEQAEYYNERHGSLPAWYRNGYEVEYTYDISGFFEAFPFINASRFAEVLGINASLMRKYKGRITVPTEKQLTIIRERYADVVSRMSEVCF